MAFMALAVAAQAATVVTFGGLGEDRSYVTDTYSIHSVWKSNMITSVSDKLSDGNSFTLFTTTGNDNALWGTSADGSIQGAWTNTDALTEINEAMGTAYTAADFSKDSTMYYTAPGNGGTAATLSFDFSQANVGESLTMYVTVTGRAGSLSSFGVTGLNNLQVSYAVNDGTGFSTSAAFSAGAANITMIKVTGNLTDSAVVLSPGGGIKAGFQSVAYNIVPEPTTATLSLLALAGLAARRRRR